MRAREFGSLGVDPRVGLGLVWWPRAWLRWVGLSLCLEDGLEATADTSEFSGELSDHALSLSVRTHLPVGPMVAIEPSIGFGGHLTMLYGTIDGQRIDGLTRVDPTVETSLLGRVRLASAIDVGIRLAVTYFLTWQTYVDEDHRAAVSSSPVQAGLGVVLGAPLN
jgi:hypothetical protein